MVLMVLRIWRSSPCTRCKVVDRGSGAPSVGESRRVVFGGWFFRVLVMLQLVRATLWPACARVSLEEVLSDFFLPVPNADLVAHLGQDSLAQVILLAHVS